MSAFVRRVPTRVAAFALSLLVLPTRAQLGPRATRITADSPLPSCSARESAARRGAETEPHLAAAPDGTLLAAWHQDRRTTAVRWRSVWRV
jgi:hypothetical protein